MLIKKEPLIKKNLGILLLGLVIMIIIFILCEAAFFPGFAFPEPVQRLNYQEHILWYGLTAILIIGMNLLLFYSLWKHIIYRLDRLSLQMDQTMDGTFPSAVHDAEEGILSRVEGQFFQLARRLQLSLQALAQEKEGLNAVVTDITHQLKTPLAAIKVYSDLLLEEGLSQPEKTEFLERIREQTAKLEWLTASLSKLSRLETGMIELKKEPADLKTTLMAAVSEVYSQASHRSIDIHIVNVQSLELLHDSQWTREAIVNILDNAIKYSTENGRISVGMEKLETYVKIDIEDQGIGIPPQEIDKVFNRFYRGQEELIKNSSGMGIGLYLSRKIIEDQGGGLIVKSEPRKGTKFTILLLHSM